MITPNHFILDVEATSLTPMTGVMTEFALAHLETEHTFYAHLYAACPHPDTPALPVVVRDEKGEPVQELWYALDGKEPVNAPAPETMKELADCVEDWVHSCGPGRGVLVSDNPGFDAMWFNCFTDATIGTLIFGHSSRRIGDFYAGTHGKWNDQSSWKKLRRTRHTHHPLDDALGNREALKEILGRSK
jgi:hypothetical protein